MVVRFPLPQPTRKTGTYFHGKEDCPQEAITTMDFSAITNALSNVASTEQVLAILGVVIGAGAGLVLTWFGARKITSAVMSALKKGTLRF